MLEVMADPAHVERLLAAPDGHDRPIDLSIAAINGPATTVLSGALAEIERAATVMTAAGVRSMRLSVSHAFHSALMDPILDKFADIAASVPYAAPQIPIISDRSGRRADHVMAADGLATPDYWVHHLREPVYFEGGLHALLDEGCNVLLEVGPKPVLLGLGQQCATDPSLLWLASLQPPKQDQRQMLESLGALYTRGVEIDWHAYHCGHSPHGSAPQRRAMLPTYPYQRQRYWIDAAPMILV